MSKNKKIKCLGFEHVFRKVEDKNALVKVRAGFGGWLDG
jgi:hypothetical protein